MPRRTDLGRKVKDILQHVGPLPLEASAPFAHYSRSATDVWNLREYVDRNVTGPGRSTAVANRHLARLDSLILLNLIDTFERFLKETAAVCIDHLAEFVLDRRFDEFQVRGSVLAAHFGAGTLGQSLCEADTWLDCRDINDRFRKLLADPFESGSFFVFPQQGQEPAADRFRYPIMSLLWQLRHTIVHNVGLITHSDAVKFRLLSQEAVASRRMLVPSRDDVRYVKRFLDETAESINSRVGQRLAVLLTALRTNHGAVFDPQERADRLTQQFALVLVVDGRNGALPPP
jgi:hypothetical protein